MIESTFPQPKQYVSQIIASGGDPCGCWVYIPCWQSKGLFPRSSSTGQKSDPINTSKSPWTTCSALLNEDLLLSAAQIHQGLRIRHLAGWTTHPWCFWSGSSLHPPSLHHSSWCSPAAPCTTNSAAATASPVQHPSFSLPDPPGSAGKITVIRIKSSLSSSSLTSLLKLCLHQSWQNIDRC